MDSDMTGIPLEDSLNSPAGNNPEQMLIDQENGGCSFFRTFMQTLSPYGK